MLQGALPYGSGALEYFVFNQSMHETHHNTDGIPFEDTRGARLAFSGSIDVGMSLLDFREAFPGNPHYQMVGLDFFKSRNGWEASGELFRRFLVGTGDSNADAGRGGYLQGVAPLGDRWFVVGRLETMQRPAEDAIRRWLIGTAWRIDEKRILKLDYMGGNAERPAAPKGLFTSYAVLF